MKVKNKTIAASWRPDRGENISVKDFVTEVCSKCLNFLECSMREFKFGFIEAGTIGGRYSVKYECSSFSAEERDIAKIKEWVNRTGGKCEISD